MEGGGGLVAKKVSEYEILYSLGMMILRLNSGATTGFLATTRALVMIITGHDSR